MGNIKNYLGIVVTKLPVVRYPVLIRQPLTQH